MLKFLLSPEEGRVVVTVAAAAAQAVTYITVVML
jgi:hypothetical protein